MATEILSAEYSALKDAHAAATTAKLFYIRNGRVVMAMNTADAAADNVFVTEADRMRVPKAAGTAWVVGQKVYYDSTNSNFTVTRAAGLALAGEVYADATSAATEGEIVFGEFAPNIATPAGVTMTVGAEAANAINVACVVKDHLGNAMASACAMPFYLSDDAAGATPSGTAPTGGIAIGTNGALIESVADLSGLSIVKSDGTIDITLTDTGTPTFYLNFVLPDGTIVTSGAITFA